MHVKKALKFLAANFLVRAGLTRRYDDAHKSILILMYHRVNAQSDCLGLTVSPDLFMNQLQFIQAHFEVITLHEALECMSSGAITGNQCVITFDDGYRDNFDVAFPLLQRFCLPATIFVTCDAIDQGQFGWGAFDRAVLSTPAKELDLQQWGMGTFSLANRNTRETAVKTLHRQLKLRPNDEKLEVVSHVVSTYGTESSGERIMLDWAEVREMAVSGLVSIGAHTITHPILSRLPAEQAYQEIVEGKRRIEQNFGSKVDFFAYPNGGQADFGPREIALVKEAGYLGACTTISGRNRAGDFPYTLRRMDITTSMSTGGHGRFSPELFAAALSGYLCRK